MKTLIFATNNKHKLEEVRNVLDGLVEVQSLKEINHAGDIPETADTLEGNAAQKAEWIFERTGKDCFADDTGLEVEALNGAPGVYSARYAGDGHDSEANMNKLLQNLTGENNRRAQFRTVIALIIKGEENTFDGIVKGEITEEKRGDSGFGYDPIFIPEGFSKSFAQMTNDEKNCISHRFRATEKLNDYLKRIYE